MTIEQLMIDAIDMHVHGAPEPLRRAGGVSTLNQLAQQAKRLV